jgi:hypothetical protein
LEMFFEHGIFGLPGGIQLLLFYYFLGGALEPKSGVGRLFVRFIEHRHPHTHPVGLLRSSDQLVAEAATYTTHNKH